MMMLSVVCVLDWNHNVDRPGKKDKNGKQLFKSKVFFRIYILIIIVEMAHPY